MDLALKRYSMAIVADDEPSNTRVVARSTRIVEVTVELVISDLIKLDASFTSDGRATWKNDGSCGQAHRKQKHDSSNWSKISRAGAPWRASVSDRFHDGVVSFASDHR